MARVHGDAGATWDFGMTDQRDEQLQERLAHLERLAEDLSEVVARQADAIDLLTRRVEMLLRREAERIEAETGGQLTPGERPPHW
jgi:SlyX protein